MNIGGDEFALSGVSTAEDLSIASVAKVSLSANIANLSSKGYTACFDDTISIANDGKGTSKEYKVIWSKYTVTRYSLVTVSGTARNLFSSRFISNETVNADGTVTYTYGSVARGLDLATGSSNLY